MIIAIAAALACAFQDTTVIRPTAPLWGERVTATRELRVGSVDGAAEYTFGQLEAMTVGAGGHMFGLDVQASTVREYDAAGRYVRSFGRSGGGPGELLRPEAIAVVGDRLVVRDPRNTRFTVFPLGGGEPESWRFETTSASNAPFTVQVDGGVATAIRVRKGDSYEPAILRFDPRGNVRDTVALPRLEHPEPVLSVSTGAGHATYTIPLMPRPTWTYLPDGRFVGGLPSRPAFLLVGGSRPVRVERNAAAVAVPDEIRLALEQGLLTVIRSGNNPDFRWNGPPIPRTMPFYNAIYIDQDGRLWLQVPGAPRQTAKAEADRPARLAMPAHFEVYDRGLRYLGLVRVPESFRFGTARGNQLWGIEADELDVQYLVRYRLNVRTP